MPHATGERTLRSALFVAALFLQGACPAIAQVRLPSGVAMMSRDTTTDFFTELKSARGDTLHGLATFRTHPTAQERRKLAASGVRVLTPLIGTTYRVRVEKRADWRTLDALEARPSFLRLTAQDRVHPWLWAEEFSRYVIAEPGRKQQNYVLNADGTLVLSVRIHAEVRQSDATTVLKRYATQYQREGNLSWVAVVPRSALRALAAEDIVQWIDPGPLPFLPENDQIRLAINVEAMQTLDPSSGLVQPGGSGVQVGVFDKGVDEAHGDLGTRVHNFAGKEFHATFMAGVIAGSGRLSDGIDSWGGSNNGAPYQWRGMAPRAELIDIDQMPPFGQNGKNPDTHFQHISASGMDFSNHSYVFSTDGAYDASNQARDEIIRGDAWSASGQRVPARLHVTSAGNNGQSAAYGRQKGYFSLTKELKNALVVGNWDFTANRIDKTSSLGPAHDGRIKPDVVAPGRTMAAGVKSTGYCAPGEVHPSCLSGSGTYLERQNFYRVEGGSSVAAAAASGALALVLEQYATTYAVNLDQSPPLPSTLRAVMIHTARDKAGNAATTNPDGIVQDGPGPDFVTGWGLIDAQAAVQVVGSRRWLEDTVARTCDSRTYLFTVPPGTAEPLRVTLAWDDVASDALLGATDLTAPRLRNDLDLVLVGPDGTSNYPWQLDQSIVDSAGNAIANEAQHCGMGISVKRQFVPATDPASNDTIPAGGVPIAVRGRDHLNNVEVVEVASPAAGTWQARVTGFAIAEEPQRFSLVGNLFTPLPLGPISFCRTYPVLCRKMAIRMDPCRRYPKICEPRIAFPAHDRIRVEFDDPGQRIVLPLDRICQYAVRCPGCGRDALCPGYDLQVASRSVAPVVEVYAADGRLVRRDRSAKRDKRIAFRGRVGERLFLVLSPAPGAALDADYEIRFRSD